jgi:hypothetical protein
MDNRYELGSLTQALAGSITSALTRTEGAQFHFSSFEILSSFSHIFSTIVCIIPSTAHAHNVR